MGFLKKNWSEVVIIETLMIIQCMYRRYYIFYKELSPVLALGDRGSCSTKPCALRDLNEVIIKVP